MNRSDALQRATLSPELDADAALSAARDLVRRGHPERARALLERSERILTPRPLSAPRRPAARATLARLRRARFDLGLYRYTLSRSREWLGWPSAGLTAPRWQLDATLGFAWSRPAVAADARTLFAAERLDHRDEHTILHAIDPRTGARLWRRDHPLHLVDIHLDERHLILQWYRGARTGRSAHHLLEVLERDSGRCLRRHELRRWCFRAPFLHVERGLALVGLDPDSTGVPDNWLDNKELLRLDTSTLEITAEPLLERPRPDALHAALHVMQRAGRTPRWHRQQVLEWYFGTPRGVSSDLVSAVVLDAHPERLLALISTPGHGDTHSLSLLRFTGDRALRPIALPEPERPWRRILHVSTLRDAGRVVFTAETHPGPPHGLHRWSLEPDAERATLLPPLSRGHAPPSADDLDALESRGLFAGGLWWWTSEGTRRLYGESLDRDAIVTAWEGDAEPVDATLSPYNPPAHPALQHVLPLGPHVVLAREQLIECRALR